VPPRWNSAKKIFCHTILPAAGPILVCVVLILLQPDLGTSVDIVLVAAAVLFVAGLSWKWLLTGAAAALPILYLLITTFPTASEAHGLSRSRV